MNNAQANIIGTSMLGAPGIGNEQAWQGLIAGENRAGEREYRMHDGTVVKYPVYPMPELRFKDWTSASTRLWLEQEGLKDDPDFIFMLAAARMAIEDAGLSERELSGAALIVGHENLGLNRLIDQLLTGNHDLNAAGGQYAEGGGPLNEFRKLKQHFFRVQSFPYLYYLAKALGIEGRTYAINNACASGLYALELGRQMLQDTSVETAIVVCADYAHATEYLWLGDLGFHSPQKQLRPFDSHRDGSLLGDGAAAVVLQSGDFRPRRQRSCFARYLGGEFRQAAWQMTLPDVLNHSYAQVIEAAVRRFAGEGPDLLVPHGTGMRLWDAFEMSEIKRAFEQADLPLPDITAFKGYFGHTLGANSLVEAVCVLHCLRHNLIPPIANFERHDFKPEMPLAGRWISKELKNAVKTVSAFGGFQAACVFAKAD